MIAPVIPSPRRISKKSAGDGYLVTGTGPSLSLSQQILFLLFHLADLHPNRVECLPARAGPHGAPCGVKVFFSEGDIPLQDVELVLDALLKEWDVGLLPRIFLGQSLQSLDLLVDGGRGRVVRFEVTGFAGDDVAALAGLGIFHRGRDVFQNAQHFLGVDHLPRIFVQLANIVIS